VLKKVNQWLASGCRVVWVSDHESQSVCAHGAHGKVACLHASDPLFGGDLLPGPKIPVADFSGP